MADNDRKTGATRIGLMLPSVRLVVWVLLSAALVYAATITAVSNITRRKAPAVALSVMPGDPVALVATAERQFSASQSKSSLARVDQNARRAVQEQSLHPAALRLLGYSADLQGKSAKAKSQVNLAARLSRRDFGAQLWLIEAAVQDGDNAKALVHYDLALRTTIASRPILFPTLTDALADAEIRAALLPYLRKKPNWMPAFLYDSIAATENPEHVMALLLSAGKFSYRDGFANVPDALLNRLASKFRFAEFEKYYLSLPNTNRSTLTSADFGSKTIGLQFAPAGWQIADADGVGGDFAPIGAGRFRLDAYASSGERGTVMRKFMFLKPGRYRLVARQSAPDTAPDARAEWIVQCLADEKATPVGSESLAVTSGKSVAEVRFDISPECRAQAIVLQAQGGSEQGGAEFSVERIELLPA